MPSRIAVAVLLVLSSVVVAVTPASATTTIRRDPGGGLLSGSTTLINTASDPLTISTSLGDITCNGSVLDLDVRGNSSATSITGTLTRLSTAHSCTDSLPVVSFTFCELHTATLPAAVLTGNGTGGAVTFVDPTFRCRAVGSSSYCYYTAPSLTGDFVNAGHDLTFASPNISFASPTSDALGSGICGATGTLGVTLTDVVQGGTGNPITLGLS